MSTRCGSRKSKWEHQEQLVENGYSRWSIKSSSWSMRSSRQIIRSTRSSWWKMVTVGGVSRAVVGI